MEKAIKAGLVRLENDEDVCFLYRIVPYRNLLLVTSIFDRNEQNFSYLSYDSIFFADFLTKEIEKNGLNFKNALDLGSGTGILTFAISNYCEKVYGIDLNPSSINIAKLNSELNYIENCSFICDNFNNCKGKSYDLIISNPPFIYFKETSTRSLDSDGGEPFGLGITLKIIQLLPELLNEKGRAYILTRSPIVNKEDYLFSLLSQILPQDFSYIYHDLSNSIASLDFSKEEDGIEAFHHVIIEIIRDDNNQRKKIIYPIFYRMTNLF
ncbi:methyltransferase [Methanocalculus sp. MC3]